MGAGAAQLLGHEPTIFPSPLAEIKAIFLFPPNSVSVFFIQLRWAEKAKILASDSNKDPEQLKININK